MSPYGLSNRVALPPAPDGISFDAATQTSTISGAPISGLAMKSWGESGDGDGNGVAQSGLAETWAGR